MRRADASTCEHRDGELGDHRHVQRHAVAGFAAERFEDVGELADFAVEVAVSKHAGVARFAFPDDGGFVAVFGEVAVEALLGDVDFAAGEPLGVGHVAVHGGRELLLPRQIFFGEVAPESGRVFLSPVPHVFVLLGRDVGLTGELGRDGEFAVFGEEDVDRFGHLAAFGM